MASQIADIESSQEGNHLNGLPESHLVPDYPPGLLTVQFPQPLHTRLLVSGVVTANDINVHVHVLTSFIFLIIKICTQLAHQV
jgi:hypothetical protein